MRLRTIIDLGIIIIFIGCSIYYARKYLGETSPPPRSVALRDELPAATGKALARLITATPATDSSDSWYPAILSNRWKYIEIYQTGLLSGNARTISKRLDKAQEKSSNDFHFIISNGYGAPDGKVVVSPLWKTQQDSFPLLDHGQIQPDQPENSHQTISICLIGDFTAQPPTSGQIASLKGLLNYLLTALPIKSYNIKFNRTSIPQDTPLSKFPLSLLLKTRTAD